MFHAWCLSPEDPHWWPIRHGPGCHQKSIPVRESPVFAFPRVAYTLGSAARSVYCVNIHRSLSPLDQHELHISESSTELELRRGDWDPMLTQEQNRGLKRWGTQHRMFYRHRKPSSKRTPQTEHTANVLE